MAYGLAYAYIATQLIMDHMSKEPFTPPWALLLLTCAFAANCTLHLVPDHLVAYTLTPIITIMYLRYVLGVIHEVCAFLGIKCLTIKAHSG